jgi:hypothetical protein
MLLAICVAADAEVCPLHRAKTEAVVIVVTRRAQAAAELAGRRIADETSRRISRGGESVPAERRAFGALVVQRALKATGEVPAGERLLVRRLVAASARCVPDRMREVGMACERVALPAADSLQRMATLGVVLGDGPRVAADARFDIWGRPREWCRVRPPGLRHQHAAADRNRKRPGCDYERSSALSHIRT